MTETPTPPPAKGERIAKRLARAGLCSRREAERWIEAGRVTVNGKVLTSPAVTVGTDETITVDGKPIPGIGETQLWLYHKPTGVMTTNNDPEGRPTVFEQLPRDLPRVISVGRLDFNSEGLLLLTNDGELARQLEMPSTGWRRRYRVRAWGRPDPARLKALEKGITVEGVRYGPIEAELEAAKGKKAESGKTSENVWLSVSLTEGKYREVRKVLEHLGLVVNRLIRVAYGPFQLGKLSRGDVRRVTGKMLKEQLGKTKQGTTGGAKPGGYKQSRPKPSGAKPGGAKPGSAKPGSAKPGGYKQSRPKPSEAKPGGARPGKPRTGTLKLSGDKPNRAKPGEAKPSKPKSAGSKQNWAKPGKAKPHANRRR